MPVEASVIDIIGYDRRGQVVLLAEVKARFGTSDEWAAQFRRNILAHGLLPPAPFFLIATLDRIYFWKDHTQEAPDSRPDFAVNTEDALAPYTERLGWPVSQAGPEAFELLVRSWLIDLANGARSVVDPPPAWAPLAESGFWNAIRDARMEIQRA